MLKHIVMFKINESFQGKAREKTLAELKSRLESLKNSIQEVRVLEVGINLGPSASASDLVLYSEFNDLAALERYRIHPEHVRVVDFITRTCSERRVVDYEGQEPGRED
jgi:hypothetical protein